MGHISLQTNLSNILPVKEAEFIGLLHKFKISATASMFDQSFSFDELLGPDPQATTASHPVLEEVPSKQ